MAIWALDASTDRLLMAVVSAGRVKAVTLEGGPSTSRSLLPHLEALLRGEGLTPHGLTGVAVGVGPGAFTGLRSACAAAQGLALGLNLEIIPLPSLLIAAEAARLESRAVSAAGALRVRVVMDARMNEVYHAAYAWTGAGWVTLEPPEVSVPATLGARWQQQALDEPCAADPWILTGSGVELLRAAIPQPLPQRLGEVCDPHARWAEALGSLAMHCASTGQRCDPAALVPHYVRDRVAQTIEERRDAARTRAGPSPMAGG